jgi:hypothetical protein
MPAVVPATRGRATTRRVLVLAAGLVLAAACALTQPEGGAAPLVVLATAVALGEWLELRTEGGSGLPVSNALMLVAAAGTTEWLAAVTLAMGIGAAATLGSRSHLDLGARLVHAGARLVTAGATIALYSVVFDLVGKETPSAIVAALAAAVAVQVLIDEGMRRLTSLPSGLGPRGRLAWLALGSSGMLMAIGYRGVEGDGELGIWGVAMFGIPLAAAWYAFDRFDSASRTHLQTIDALARAPELGGLVRDGHAVRVAGLCADLAVALGLDDETRAHLDTAAKLHHLGVVTLDDPAVAGAPHPPALVADVTAAMLGEIDRLAPAGRIVGAEPLPHRAPGGGAGPDLASKILKVASDFDDLAEGDPARAAFALEALYSGPGYVYDSAVLVALERILETRRPPLAALPSLP